MSIVDKSIKLYAWKTNHVIFPVVQGESKSRTINIQLFSTTIPVNLTGCSVKLYAIKPDTTKIYLDCEIVDIQNGLIAVTLTEQVGVLDGVVDCWIQVIGQGASDLRFEGMSIEVTKCDLSEAVGGDIESDNEFKAFMAESARLAAAEHELRNARGNYPTLEERQDAQEKRQDAQDENLRKETEERESAVANEKSERQLSISKEKSERQQEIAVERARIDSLATLKAGSTTGDAELQDIRIAFDSSTHLSAGTAIRKQIEYVLNKEKNNVFDNIIREVLYDNVIDTGEISEDKFVTTDKAIYDSTAWDYYTFNVKGGEKYYIVGSSASSVYAVSLFDDDDSIVKSYPEILPSEVTSHTFEEITIPSNATYMVVHCCKGQRHDVSVTRIYDMYRVIKEEIIIDQCEKTSGYYNVTELGTKHASAFIGSLGVIYEVTSWDYYEFDVRAGEKYRVKTHAGSSAPSVMFYDNRKGLMTLIEYKPSELPPGNYYLETEVEVPNDANLMFVNHCNAMSDLLVVEKMTYSYFVPKGNYYKMSNFLSEKVLVAAGDSITEGMNPDGGHFKNYAELVAERNNMTYHNCGISGSTMTNIEGKNPFSGTRYLNLPEFDYLTIWFGWNDNAYAELGTIDDTDNTTFYGAYKIVLEYLITTYPTKKIGIIVPYGVSDDMAQAVRNLSNMFGVPCLDLPNYNKCSLLWGMKNTAQLVRRNALTYDGTHPNQIGFEFLSTIYENFIKSL